MDPGPECGHRQTGDRQPPLDVCLPVGPLHLWKCVSLKGIVEECASSAREDIGPAFGVPLEVAGASEICDLRLGEGGL